MNKKITSADMDEACAADYRLLLRQQDTPAEADFALTLTDDCMEPYFKQNEEVFVQARGELEEFEAGIFYYDGRVLCRQWCEDYRGNVHLLCANPHREAQNIMVEKNAAKKLSCLGKVLSKKKLPPPSYR